MWYLHIFTISAGNRQIILPLKQYPKDPVPIPQLEQWLQPWTTRWVWRWSKRWVMTTCQDISELSMSASEPFISHDALRQFFASWWFQIYIFYFHHYLGKWSFWLIFFKWVETTNQFEVDLFFATKNQKNPESVRSFSTHQVFNGVCVCAYWVYLPLAILHHHILENLTENTRCLKPGGKVAIQAICVPDERYESYRNPDRVVIIPYEIKVSGDGSDIKSWYWLYRHHGFFAPKIWTSIMTSMEWSYQ